MGVVIFISNYFVKFIKRKEKLEYYESSIPFHSIPAKVLHEDLG